MQALIDHAEALSKNIGTIKDPVTKKDLRKMLDVINRQLTALSKAGVECNRLRRPTQRYETIAKECELLLKNLEQHLIYARLRHG
jgi:hypothetical protein